METASKEEIIYGKNAVTEALKAERSIDTVYLLKNSQGMNKIIALAKKQGLLDDCSAAFHLNYIYCI